MATSFEERGRLRGVREMFRRQLEKKFGRLAPDALSRLELLPLDRLEELSLAILDATTLDDLGLGNSPPKADG